MEYFKYLLGIEFIFQQKKTENKTCENSILGDEWLGEKYNRRKEDTDHLRMVTESHTKKILVLRSSPTAWIYIQLFCPF